MGFSPSRPGAFASALLILLAGGAMFCGVDAMLAESVRTPAKHGDGAVVRGFDTVLVGLGWMLIGLGLIAKAVASRFKLPGQHWIPIACCIGGGVAWMMVFL